MKRVQGSGFRVQAVLALLLAATGLRAEEPATKPADPAPQQIRHLVDQLGAKDYFVRQRAEASLAKFGFAAFDALSQASTSADLEVASRAKRLLRLMKVEWSGKADPPKVLELLRDYGLQDQERRGKTIEALAALPNEAGITSLCRLVRYEKAPLLARLAALQILTAQKKSDGVFREETVRQIRESLTPCPRPAAQWVLLSLRSAAEPQVMTEPWTRLIDAEEAVLKATPSESSPTIVADLLRFQVERLKKLGRGADAAPAVMRLVKLEKGDRETLRQLFDWLIEQKEWKTVDSLAERFSAAVDANAILLYLVAEAQAEQGQVDRAEKTADRALKLNPTNQQDDIFQHYFAAGTLQVRGRFAWAKREYRHIIAQGQPTADTTVRVQYLLSEMLHDIGEDREAAEVLEQTVQAVGANRPPEAQIVARTLGEVRARMHYFHACHWLAKGDLVKQREELDKALEADAGDIDVLIACYRIPDPKPAYREKIRNLIRRTAADLREKVIDEPENPANCNQFAWLVGNTEGNLDEALLYSKKSVELTPAAGGYYDTLGRVYFAKGDLDNAIKTQSKAAEMEPHSGLIRRQLELFKKARDEKKRT